jgi:hypothetical protein
MLMVEHGAQSITIPTLADTSLTSWSQFIGVVMIAAGILGGFVAHRRTQ